MKALFCCISLFLFLKSSLFAIDTSASQDETLPLKPSGEVQTSDSKKNVRTRYLFADDSALSKKEKAGSTSKSSEKVQTPDSKENVRNPRSLFAKEHAIIKKKNSNTEPSSRIQVPDIKKNKDDPVSRLLAIDHPVVENTSTPPTPPIHAQMPPVKVEATDSEEGDKDNPVDAEMVSAIVMDQSLTKVEASLIDPVSKIDELSKKEAIKNANDYNECPTFELTLEILFNCIEAENLTVLLNREKIEEAFQVANIARAELLPQFSLTLEQTRSRVANDFGPGDVNFTFNLFNGIINGSLVLFDLTKLAGYEEAKMGETITILNYNAILQAVLTDAATLYFQHIKNLRGLNVIDANLHQAKVLLDLAKTRFNAGVASPIDVTRAEVQVAIYERQQLELLILIKQSELYLKRILDLDMRQEIFIPNVKLEKDPPAPEISIPSLNAILLNRFDYLKENAILTLNEFQEEAAFWDYFPKINLSGTWGYAAPIPFDGIWLPEWSITLSLNMPLFDGFRIRSNVLREGSRVRQQKDLLLDLANTISTEITLNSYTLETRFAEIDLVRRQVLLGEKELELAKTRFQEGVADNTEVVNAQTKLAIFLDDLVGIIYAYDISRLDWARTRGDVHLLLDEGLKDDK